MFPPGREAGDEPRRDGIGGDAPHDDRYRAGRVPGSKARRGAGGHDELDLHGDELGRERGQPVVAVLREAVLDDEVLALDVAALAQTLAKPFDHEGAALAGADGQKPDPRDLSGLLTDDLVGQKAQGCHGRASLQELAAAMVVHAGSQPGHDTRSSLEIHWPLRRRTPAVSGGGERRRASGLHCHVRRPFDTDAHSMT
jgi:hypothetical protein